MNRAAVAAQHAAEARSICEIPHKEINQLGTLWGTVEAADKGPNGESLMRSFESYHDSSRSAPNTPAFWVAATTRSDYLQAGQNSEFQGKVRQLLATHLELLHIRQRVKENLYSNLPIQWLISRSTFSLLNGNVIGQAKETEWLIFTELNVLPPLLAWISFVFPAYSCAVLGLVNLPNRSHPSINSLKSCCRWS